MIYLESPHFSCATTFLCVGVIIFQQLCGLAHPILSEVAEHLRRVNSVKKIAQNIFFPFEIVPKCIHHNVL